MTAFPQPRLPAEAALVAALFAVDPAGTGGVALRAGAGPLREAWLARLRELLPEATPWRRVPLGIHDERLIGGLDLGATLQSGRPVGQRGVLAEADGGVLVLAMAERLSAGTAARIASVLDQREVAVERDGIGTRRAAHFGVLALDEGQGDDERLPPALLDRLAFPVVLDQPGPAGEDDGVAEVTPAEVRAARRLLPTVEADDDILRALCSTALALGVDSLRACHQALRAACALAALTGRDEVDEQDAVMAARLVLAPRATRLPAPPEDAAAEASPPPETPDDAPAPAEPPPPAEASEAPPSDEATDADAPEPAELEDVVLAAALAAIPPGLLAGLKLGQLMRAQAPAVGRAGAVQQGRARGRPSGVRAGEPRQGTRLNLLETLRAAAPWQPLRRRELAVRAPAPHGSNATPRILVRRDDFRVTRYTQRSVTTTIFAVDASGSAALARLAEAKGAVELLLADCYVRRDNVAVVAFRGKTAELLLPPTRSLVRAKRSLAGLPGGGGTPLATGIDAAAALADAVRRRGETPIVVLLTDGRANVAADGSGGRARASTDAHAAAQRLRAAGFTALLIDTSAQPDAAAEALSRSLGAVYLPLPYAGAAGMSQAVKAVQMARAAAPAPR